MSHEALVRIAAAALAAQPIQPFLPRHISDRRRDGLMKAVAQSLRLPPDRYPKFPRRVHRRAGEGEKRRYADLEHRRNAHASRLGIDPTLIASRAILSDLACDWDKHARSLMTWQRDLLKP
jgi:ribonuclease D